MITPLKLQPADDSTLEDTIDGYAIRTRDCGQTSVPYTVGVWHSAYVLLGYAPRLVEIEKAEAALKTVVHGRHTGDLRGARLEIGEARVQVVGDRIAVHVMFRTQRHVCGCGTSGPCSHGNRGHREDV